MLTMNFSRVLRRFATPLPVDVYDVACGYVDGAWKWGEPALRVKNIQAIVLQLSVEQVRQYRQGDVSDGGIAVWTKEWMHITGALRDDDAVLEGGDLQSFVIYQDQKWRVVGDGFLSGRRNLGITVTHCWHCVRWFE